jgi:putative ABC transport system substrate-binding protein
MRGHRIKRRQLLAAIAAASAWPLASRGQDRVPRLGYIWIGPPGSDNDTWDGLEKGLSDQGYVIGRTLIAERRYADGHPERLPALARELVAIPVDAIISPGTVVTTAVQYATKTIPVVAASGDMVGAGLAASLSHPGGNITGFSLGSGEALAGKWIELLKQGVPTLARVAVLYAMGNPIDMQELAVIQRAAEQLKIDVFAVGVETKEEIDRALAKILTTSVGGLIVPDDVFLDSQRPRIIAFAAEHRVPAIYGVGIFVQDGGLMSYSASIYDLWRRAAGYVDRILKGANPADLPIEQPTLYDFKINMRTARALGLDLPQSLLAQANEVIE